MPMRRASSLEIATRLAPVSTSICRRTPLTIGSTKKCPFGSATSVTQKGDDGGAGRVSPLLLASFFGVFSPRRRRRSAFSSAPVASRCLGASASVRTIREDQSNFHDLMGPPLDGYSGIVAQRSTVRKLARPGLYAGVPSPPSDGLIAFPAFCTPRLSPELASLLARRVRTVPAIKQAFSMLRQAREALLFAQCPTPVAKVRRATSQPRARFRPPSDACNPASWAVQGH